MIVACRHCHTTGKSRAFNPWMQVIRVVCPDCNGAGKWRDGAEFTALEHIEDISILRDMARIIPWMKINTAIGKIVFHVGPGIPEDSEELLKLVGLSARIATYMETHNWLVTLL